MKKNKRGFSPIILGIIILVVIVVISLVIFATSNNNKSSSNDYDSSYDYNQQKSNIKKLNLKDVSKIVYEGNEYDLTKTLRETGMLVAKLTDITSEQVVEYNELKNKAEETRNMWYNEYSDTIDINNDDICNTLTLKPNQTVECWFETSDSNNFGSGTIINNSNSNKSILDCNVKNLVNVVIIKEGGISLNNLSVGESTRDEVIKKYKKYAIENNYNDDIELECKDGSKVTFRFHDEDSSVSDPDTISYIEIELKY